MQSDDTCSGEGNLTEYISDWKSLVHPDEALVVLGSLHAFPQDRKLARSEVRPVQIIMDGEIHHAPFFDHWGEWGVISLAWRPGWPAILYVATETELFKVDLSQQVVFDLEVPNLRDLHEMTMMGETLWLANTGSDQVVAFDVVHERVSERVNLSAYGSAPKIVSRAAHDADDDLELAGDVREKDEKFHCNQVFESFGGDRLVLVHYALGNSQLIRRAARRLLKRQGNGGVINLDTGHVTPLGLKGPHTVRKVQGDYWICDSGRSRIAIYDSNWDLRETIPSKGWVRGADISNALGLFYTGISRFRRRYLALNPTVQQVPNMVQAISVQNKRSVAELVLSGIERVTNTYVIPREVALAMIELRPDRTIDQGIVS
jgi:Domain of unknown function (DUF4915)